MSSTYRSRAAADDGPSENYLPCSSCRGPTLRETLAQYGSMCSPCFGAYTRHGPAGAGAIGHQLTREHKLAILSRLRGLNFTKADRAWARALRESGESLSLAQRTMAAAALKEPA